MTAVRGDGMNVISVRMPDSLRRRVEKVVRERGFHNLSALVRVAVSEYIKEAE